MKMTETKINGAKLILPDMYTDDRGFFSCISDQTIFSQVLYRECVARSHPGVLRGLHIRSGVGEEKLVRCSSGAVYDVIVDLRKNSPTYRQWQGFWLEGSTQIALLVPAGCAHGYQAYSKSEVTYRISGEYDSEADLAVNWDDPELAINWPLRDPILSERDRNAPSLSEVEELL